MRFKTCQILYPKKKVNKILGRDEKITTQRLFGSDQKWFWQLFIENIFFQNLSTFELFAQSSHPKVESAFNFTGGFEVVELIFLSTKVANTRFAKTRHFPEYWSSEIRFSPRVSCLSEVMKRLQISLLLFRKKIVILISFLIEKLKP